MLDPVLAGQARVDEPTAEAERDPPQRVWRVVPLSKRERAPAWVVGKLVHESLALWRFPDDGFGRWAEARACSYGLIDPGRLHNAIRASRQVLERFVANDLKRLMDSAQQRLHEVPYHVMRDGRLESGSIDALYLRDGQWTVVEFKTDEIRSDARLVQLLSGDDYRGQAERYIEAMERLVGVRPRFVWCMLNYAGSVRLQAHPEA